MFSNHKFNKTWLTVCIMPAMLLFLAAPCYSQSMKDTANTYFAALKKDFDKLAKNPALKKPKVSPVNGLFVTALKKHQPTTSLVRVNAKGVIVNEVIRGEVPLKKVNKKAGDLEWYSTVIKSKKEYDTVTEENGRFYLLWSKPLMGAKKRVTAVVVAKIDIWDCFQLLSKETTSPYLVRMEKKTLYSHKWKTGSNYLEEPLEIPGIEEITFLTEKPAAVRAGETLDVSVQRVVPAAPEAQVAPKAPDKNKKKGLSLTKNRKLLIIIGIVVLIILIILIVRFYVWLNHKFVMHSINKPD
jgi:hypothetical protein